MNRQLDLNKIEPVQYIHNCNYVYSFINDGAKLDNTDIRTFLFHHTSIGDSITYNLL